MNERIDFSRLQLTEHGETDILVRRSFAHPPARVWRVMTDAALIPEWMASSDAMTRCEIDLRPGGSFYYEWRGDGGPGFYFSGPILTVKAPHHMVHVEHFNGDMASGTTVITDLAAEGAGTRMTITMRYADAQARADAVEIGMTDGFDGVYDRLEALLYRE